MKKITLLLLIIAISVPNFLSAQEKKVAKKVFGQELTIANQRAAEETGYIRCATTEYERALQERFPERISKEAFENWLAPKVEEVNTLLESGRGTIYTIPVVFHVLTDGAPGGENLSQAAIQAQIDQLNIDYANLAGSPFGVAADTDVRFCLAQQDPSGATMVESGINRITDYGGTAQSMATMDGGIKQATQWDPTRYMNIWTANLSGGILGYAQFPTGSGLPMYSGGPSDTDGVVVLASSVGSIANPNPLGGVYASGRTLTHEAGHWLGLHHIWGDGGCTVDDYCDDTPAASGSNFGCPSSDSCAGGDPDMVENYMDYTDDTCMDTFTADQRTRIVAVMTNSPNRMELATSNACSPGVIYDLDGRLNIEDLNVTDCSTSTMSPDVKLTNAGNITLTSATISYYIDGDTPVDYNWSGSLEIDEFEIISLPELTTTTGAHTFYAELSNPNGGTDLNTVNDNASDSYTFTGGLCASVGNTVYETSVEGVILNDGTTDILSNLNTGKPAGYYDYTDIITDVTQGESYSMTVNVNTDGNWLNQIRVWIDWNQNCIFDDTEEYDLGTAQNVVNGPTSNSGLAIVVPNDAVLGNTTMRITNKFFEVPTPCEVTDGSGGSVDAEVEDYTLNVMAPLSIDEFGLNSISIYPNPTTNVLNISLSNSDLPDGYKIYNMLGQTLSQKVISNVSDLSVNTANLSNGMYFIQITREGNTVSLPFIKK